MARKLVYFIIFILILIVSSFIYDTFSTRHLKFIKYNVKKDEFNIPYYKEGKEIPRNIYRIYGLKDNKIDLEKYKGIFEETKKKSPTIRENLLMGKEEIENFVYEYYGEKVLDTIKLINYNYSACVSDIIRLLIIYAKGGIYLDIKTQVTGDLNHELKKYKDKMLVSYFSSIPFTFTGWSKLPPYGEISNWFLASPKGNPVLRECIIQSLTNIQESYKKKEQFKTGLPYILSLTGPHMLTNVINNSKNIDKVKILPTSSFENFTSTGWMGKLKKGSYILDNTKIQGETHWKKLQEPLFI